MKIYIDKEYKCHTSDPEGAFREFEVAFFDDKCQTFIEGCRYCPEGESYIREDGEEFHGECVTFWKDFSELDKAQREYELQLIEEYKIKENELYASYQEGVNSI